MRARCIDPGDAPNWVAEAADDYRVVGWLPLGRIGKALKPVVDAVGWATVRPWWQHYIRYRPYQRPSGEIDLRGPRQSRWMGPENFVSTLATWQDLAEEPPL